MDFDTRINREILIGWFPNLGTDTLFKITSPDTPVYNCIAWAMGLTDRWVDHEPIPGHWWPDGVQKDTTCESLLNAFKSLNFELTDNYDFDSRYDKVVLYGYNGEWRHASRIIGNNLEHSKFGGLWDGIHCHDIFKDDLYGTPYACMRRPVNSFDFNSLKKQGRIKVLKKPVW